ncbi:MAG: DUF2027 domain-containing protein [Bacteroidales bacterium]|nr:DUF2027 domain-containing protein [Bacteroidales bacterium]
MAKTGDIVRFLNSVGGGRITRIEGTIAYVDEDGFETPVLLRECVVVTPAGGIPDKMQLVIPKEEISKAKESKAEPAPTFELPFVETAEGETLNIVLGYEAQDLKRLSQSAFDAYLVNDSNYFLYFTYLTRGDEQNGWTTRYAGMVEPGTQVLLGEVEREQLPLMDRVAIQYIAFKQGREFQAKAPAWVEVKLDTTKFFKLHCFQRNTYFDEPVIAVPIVRSDIPARQIEIDPHALNRAMREKSQQAKPMSRPSQKKQMAIDGPLVVDLHINELIDNTSGLNNTDMLNVQLDKFREVMDTNLKNHGRKIVFIHGKGEGVLRKALLKELSYRYKGCEAQDASFQEYGYGATQIKIK